MDTPTPDNWTGAPLPEAPVPTPSRSRQALRRRAAGIATLTGLTVGGIAGGYIVTHAASASPSPSASASPQGGGYGMPGDGHGPRGGMGMRGAPGEDLQVAATAIGISLSDLQSALQNGQTIAAVAKAHNVDVNTVINALVAAENKEVDDALAAGRITQAQATQMKANQTQRVTDMVNGSFRGGPGGPGGHHGLQSEDLAVVAGAIGISTSDLQSALQGGQTIAAVAKAHNVDVNKVISAWVASENKEIDDRVTSGQITQAQATQMKQQTQQRVTDMVNGTFRGGPGGHDGHFGGPGAPAGGTQPSSGGPTT